MTMLMKYDVFSEDVTRFYMAECILAIEAVHNLGYIHRYAFLCCFGEGGTECWGIEISSRTTC
jgi:hypothetical protein